MEQMDGSYPGLFLSLHRVQSFIKLFLWKLSNINILKMLSYFLDLDCKSKQLNYWLHPGPRGFSTQANETGSSIRQERIGTSSCSQPRLQCTISKIQAARLNRLPHGTYHRCSENLN